MFGNKLFQFINLKHIYNIKNSRSFVNWTLIVLYKSDIHEFYFVRRQARFRFRVFIRPVDYLLNKCIDPNGFCVIVETSLPIITSI